MKIHSKLWVSALGLCSTVFLSGAAFATDAPVAVVNGVSIAARLMDRNVEANVAQGQKDTPELRAALKQELVARELMTQEAQKRGLDKLPSTQDALVAMRQNLLIELVLNDEFTKNPIAEAELKAEMENLITQANAFYDREIARYED